MKKRVLTLLLSCCLISALTVQAAVAWPDEMDSAYAEFGEANGLTTEQLAYMEQIYAYFTIELELNTAAASGLLANIYRESRFDPAVNSASETTIGIVQWYGSNRTAEIDWCEENGYDPWSLEGQLLYLTYQLEGSFRSVYNYLLSVEDSAEGAYDAAWYFCCNFERPSDTETAADSRGILAQETIYPFCLLMDEYGVTCTIGESTGTESEEDSLPFLDVDEEDWYYEVILYAYLEDMIDGTSETTFDPESSMTRAQAVQILYNLSGTPDLPVTSPFTDVAEDAWYADAVNWAWAAGCVSGVSEDSFSPDGILTREQMAQILYNYYTNYLGYESTDLTALTDYADYTSVTFGMTAMQWAVGNGIINGISDSGQNYLQPEGQCTRAQGCAMLVRLVSD